MMGIASRRDRAAVSPSWAVVFGVSPFYRSSPGRGDPGSRSIPDRGRVLPPGSDQAPDGTGDNRCGDDRDQR